MTHTTKNRNTEIERKIALEKFVLLKNILKITKLMFIGGKEGLSERKLEGKIRIFLKTFFKRAVLDVW